MALFDNFLFKAGIMPKREWLIKSFPNENQEDIRFKVNALTDIRNVSDPNKYFDLVLDLSKSIEQIRTKQGSLPPQLEEAYKSFIVRGSADLFGYRPSGTRIWNYFANPFGVFAYIQENYAPVRMCLDLITNEIESDGFLLQGADGVSEKKLLEYYKILKSLNIEQLRSEMIRHIEGFGNVWICPHKNFLKGVVELEILYPNRVLPVFDRSTEEIVEWEYVVGRTKRIFTKDELLHLKLFSPQGKQIGSPPLVALVTDIEASLSASAYNNMVFQKGGLVGTLIAMESPKEDSDLGVSNEFVNQLQSQWNSLWSGSKGASGAMFANHIKGVHKLTDLKNLDSAFLEGKDHTAKQAAYLLGIPSEKIGINRSSNVQYQASLVEDVLNAQFDKTVNRLTNMVDGFLNKKVLRDLLGITDAKIIAAGRYGALTLAGAEVILKLSQSGLAPTRNELRTKVLGWEPLPPDDTRGEQVIDISINRNPESLPELIGLEHPDPDLETATEFDESGKLYSDKCNRIYIGGKKNGILYTKNKKIDLRRNEETS